MMDAVDELNQESIKFNKHQNLMLKQFQEKTRFIQKRQLENQAREQCCSKLPFWGPLLSAMDVGYRDVVEEEERAARAVPLTGCSPAKISTSST